MARSRRSHARNRTLAWLTNRSVWDTLPAIAQSHDYFAVCDVLARYCHGLDDLDWSMVRTCFTPDVRLVYADVGDFGGYEAWETGARRILGNCRRTHHLLGSIRLTFDGDACAARSHFQASHLMLDGELLMTGGSYHDALRWDGVHGWRIATREMVRHWGEGPNNRSSARSAIDEAPTVP